MRRGVCLRQGEEAESKYSVNEVCDLLLQTRPIIKDLGEFHVSTCDVHTNVVYH